MVTLLVCLFGLLLPTQLGLHLWPSWSYVYGLRIDYLSPTIYLTDLLLLTLFVVNLKVFIKFVHQHFVLFFLMFGLIGLNLIFALNLPTSLIAWLRLILLINFIVFVSRLSVKQLHYLFISLASSTLIICVLVFLQTISQASINGFAYYLGERRFYLTTPNLARISFFGHQLIRPYASFSHPNSLAGYLLVLFLLFRRLKSKNFLLLLTLAVIPVSLFLTFSRVPIILFIVSLFMPQFPLLLSLIIFLTNTLIFVFPLPILFFFKQSFTDRLFLTQNALEIIKNRFLFGVGLNNFIYAQGNYHLGLKGSFIFLQPVHNLFFLLLTELGSLPLVISLYTLIKKLPHLKSSLFITLLSVVIITSSLDHYWVTLPQNRLLLALLFGLIFNHQANNLFFK